MLAKQEMILVKDLDDALISEHKKKLYLYYGSKDGWTPAYLKISTYCFYHCMVLNYKFEFIVYFVNIQLIQFCCFRYPIEDKRAIFMFRDGAQAVDAKNFSLNNLSALMLH